MFRNSIAFVHFSRNPRRIRSLLALAVLMVVVTMALVGTTMAPNLAPYADPSGHVQTFTTQGAFDLSNPFFQNLGTNDRTCATCHQQSDGWTVTPAHLQQRFAVSQGMDPIFRPVDGAVCPSADVSTVAARQSAYSMLLSKGLIRISLTVPANADFSVLSANDPHDCRDTTLTQLALFRRPLPSTNLGFLTTVMWDGRESFAGNSLEDNLKHQAMDATTGHAQGQPPTPQQIQAIVDFEKANYTAQGDNEWAGNLSAQGAKGGAVSLSAQKFYVGINDPLGGNPTGAAFDQSAFTLFSKWGDLKNSPIVATDEARASVARGEVLFNTLPITISGVAGLNDKPGVAASFTGSCTTCHNTPNVGDHSVPLAINIGVTDYPALMPLDTTGLPVYTIVCKSGGNPITTTDPGRAMITGKCSDIGKTKGPILRGLASRAPYFHNGSAATLEDVVEFYNNRFGLTLTDQQKKDLVAFLSSL